MKYYPTRFMKIDLFGIFLFEYWQFGQISVDINRPEERERSGEDRGEA